MLDFLRNLLDPLFNIMGGTLSTFHGWGAPWWLAIVMLTIVVRTLLFPITYRQVKSMRRMQDLKPDMDRIRAEYKDDVQKQREEMAKLYRERQVNPLGGCLPVFIQLPIFLVLYYTIRHFDTLESFRTGGLLWFQDLTIYDHLFILPVLYVLTMMASQELTIRNTATQQKQLMRFLPIIFGVFLARFPSGLFVYWEPGEEDAEDYGEEPHELFLLGGRVPYGQLLGGHHGQDVEDGEDKEVVVDRQVLEPQEATGPEAFQRVEVPDRVVQDEEDGELNKDGQASPERVDLPLPVELRHLLPLLLDVVFVLGPNPVHVRFQVLHPAHALDLAVGDREEQRAHNDGEHDDGQPPRRTPTVEGRERSPHQVEQRV